MDACGVVMKSKKTFDVSERPITSEENDFFEVKPRLVNKILDIIKNKGNGQLAIAVAGEWGVGKSSAINLLKNELERDRKNIVIRFEPILEGRYEIGDIIELFYLKLHTKLESIEVKPFVRKCLKSFAILTKGKITANLEVDAAALGLPGKAGVKTEYNIGENVDALLDLWDEKKPKDFSDMTVELNTKLADNKIRLCIFIDEIDRLPATYIINFLLFCRILEAFDQMVCIIGVDYEKVIGKLKNESHLCLDNYEQAKDYIDKLFQVKYNVHHNQFKKIEYAITQLEDDGFHSIFDEIIQSDDPDVSNRFESIIDYLSNPRQIKKWLIALRVNLKIFQSSSIHKLSLMSFCAATVKHPILVDYLSRHALRMRSKSFLLNPYIKERYGVDFSGFGDNNRAVLIASMGFDGMNAGDFSSGTNYDDLPNRLIALREKLNVHQIDDVVASEYTSDFFEISEYIQTLFVEGYIEADHVSLFQKFFGDHINEALIWLKSDDPNTSILVSDIANTLRKGLISIAGVPDIKLLSELWAAKITDKDFFNPYEIVITCAMSKLSMSSLIDNCSLGMTEIFLINLLLIFGIKNKNGSFIIDDFTIQPSIQDLTAKGMQDLEFNGLKILNFDKVTLRKILSRWLLKAEADLNSLQEDVYSQVRLISVFYRYLQWGLAVDGNDRRGKLASYVINFLKADGMDDVKSRVRAAINHERDKFTSMNWGVKEDPMDTLFNNSGELLSLL